ncbi:MAG TPA: alpha/beta fold hydrolase [Ktedonobacterales bacterium]
MADATNRQSGYADVNGGRLYYEVAGAGHPLVLLHAGIADSRMWDEQFEAFAQHYRVVRYDYRGYGKSSPPVDSFSMREDLYALLRQLGFARASLIGVSMGGGLAVDAAIERPDLVAALIPTCPGLSGQPDDATPEETAFFEQVEATEKAGDMGRVNELEVHLWVDGLSRTPEQVNPAVRAKVREMNGLALRRQGEWAGVTTQKLEPSAYGRLDEIAAPTLAIIGDRDLSEVKQAVDLIAAGVPGARKATIADAAHVPNMEHPAEYNRLVLDFLGALP